jgi:predicted lactoylglutathione lyase
MLADSAAEVDERARLVAQAGGTITKQPTDAEFFEGRSCYFADPESNYWEIVWVGGDSVVLAAARRAAGLVSE